MNRYLSAILLLCSFCLSVQVAASTLVPIRVGEITIFIPIDDPPEVASDIITVDEDDTIDLGPILLRNDMDEAMDSVQIVIASPADLSTLNGTLTQNGNILSYTPAPNEWGEAYDSFTYYLVDTEGNTSDVATVTLYVNSINDRPVHTPPSYPGHEQREVVEDTTGWNSYNGTIGVTDVDGDDLYVSDVTAQNGTVSLVEPKGIMFSYRPAPDFRGIDDVFVYVSDGTDIIRVYYRFAVANTPDPLVVNRKVETGSNGRTKVVITTTDPDGPPEEISAEITGTVVRTSPKFNTCFNFIQSNTCQYDWDLGVLPQGNYTLNVYGADDANVAFEYAASSGTGYSFSIGMTNDAPVANDDSFTLKGDGNQNILDVTVNDSDPNADMVSVTGIVGSPSHGTAELVNGMLVYKPSQTDASRTDSLVYRITDGEGAFDDATVAFDIIPIDNRIPPVFDLTMQLNGETGLTMILVKTGTQVGFSWSRPDTSYSNIVYCLSDNTQDDGDGISTNSTDANHCLATTTETQLNYTFNTLGTKTLYMKPCVNRFTFSVCGTSDAVTVRVTDLALRGLSASASVVTQGDPVTLSWDAIIGNDIEYIIEVDRPESQNGEQTVNWTRLESDRRFTDSQRTANLNSLGTYRYRIKVCSDSLGCGEFSSPVSIVVEEFVVPNIETLSINLTSEAYVLELSWSSVDLNGVYYRVEVNTPTMTAGTWQAITLSSSNTTSQSYSATDDDGSYTFRVAACIGTSNCSEWREASLDVDGSVRSRRVIFIHTDLLGSPVAETDENEG